MSAIWQATVILETEASLRFEAAVEDRALSLSRFEETADGRLWRLETLFAEPPDIDWLMHAANGIDVAVAPVAQQDWVSLSQSNLPPIRAGRFHLHGSHDPADPARNVVDLLIEAGQAFGTGRHESTRGCLLMLERLLRHRRKRRHVLDLGCGSGVLGLSAARAWKVSVLASDNDPIAVRVTLENAKVNHAGRYLRAVTATGFRHRRIAGSAPYDLIFANILARPLVRLAPEAARHLGSRGAIILSGLLSEQEAMVRNAYVREGLRLAARVRLQGWTTLLMERIAAAA